MNKPPERVRVVINKLGSIHWNKHANLACFDLEYPTSSPHTEHFYTLEKEPVQKKTENLTTEEAWAAMARGECVNTRGGVHRIIDCSLYWWVNDEWGYSDTIGSPPYSIVPDPSKPKEVETDEAKDELRIWEIAKEHLKSAPIDGQIAPSDLIKMMIKFMHETYARKP